VKEIFVYLEGQSDQIGMRRLLSHPIDCATAKGNRVEFYFMGGKKIASKQWTQEGHQYFAKQAQ
jgi:hypothetical protein